MDKQIIRSLPELVTTQENFDESSFSIGEMESRLRMVYRFYEDLCRSEGFWGEVSFVRSAEKKLSEYSKEFIGDRNSIPVFGTLTDEKYQLRVWMDMTGIIRNDHVDSGGGKPNSYVFGLSARKDDTTGIKNIKTAAEYIFEEFKSNRLNERTTVYHSPNCLGDYIYGSIPRKLLGELLKQDRCRW